MIKWQIKFTVEKGTATQVKKMILSFMCVMKSSELADTRQERECSDEYFNDNVSAVLWDDNKKIKKNKKQIGVGNDKYREQNKYHTFSDLRN